MKPTIIQLLGLARSGKDWTAEQLKLYFESQGKSVEILAYAKPMKRIVSTMFGISLAQLEECKNNPQSFPVVCGDHGRDYMETDFRQILQQFGNQAMKSEFGDSVWADLMKSNIDKSSADILIIPDCRFLVELATIGGFTIRVINKSLPSPMNHASELELLDYQTNAELDNTNYGMSLMAITNLGKRILDETVS